MSDRFFKSIIYDTADAVDEEIKNEEKAKTEQATQG